MPDYSQQVQPADRWAISAYIRALQLSQHATEADVPAGTQVSKTVPEGVVISPPYDTQATTAASAAPQAAASDGGAQK